MPFPKSMVTKIGLNDSADSRAVYNGELIGGSAKYLAKQNPTVGGPTANGVSPYQLATVQPLFLPDGFRASAIIRATSKAGGVTGELAAQAYGATPLTGQIAVAPNGDIVVLAADAITDLDVHSHMLPVDVVEAVFDISASASILTLPATMKDADGNDVPVGVRGAVYLMEAEALVGTVIGKQTILVPGAASATTKQARLSVAKTQVLLNVADAVTKVRVKLAINKAML